MSGLLDTIEGRRAQTSPREMKDPRSREYAIQTLASLKRYLESKQIDEQRLREELTRIKDNRHWEVLDYPSLDEYLKAETGLTAAEILGRAKRAVKKAQIAAAREAGPLVNGGDRRSDAASDQFDNSKTETKGGNDPTYLARRILTEAPELLDQCEADDSMTIRAAAKSIGIVKDKPTKAIPIETPDAAVQSLRKVFSDEAIAAALKADQEDEPLPTDDEDKSFARIVDRLSVSERVGLMLYLMRDPDAIPDDAMNAPAMAREWFNALDHDDALSFMEWANNQFWQSKAA